MSSHAGDVSLNDAWVMLRDQPTSVLLDVRTEAEWAFVGIPDLASLEKEVRLVQWTTYPNGESNIDFLRQATADLEPGQPVLVLCRSGARSQQAAEALTAAGYGPAYNVSAGFEGDLDDDGHRSGGWKSASDPLPWRQS